MNGAKGQGINTKVCKLNNEMLSTQNDITQAYTHLFPYSQGLIKKSPGASGDTNGMDVEGDLLLFNCFSCVQLW